MCKRPLHSCRIASGLLRRMVGARVVVTLAASIPSAAFAQPAEEAAMPAARAAPATEATAPSRAPYNLPWQLRPALAPSVLRYESAVAFRDEGDAGGAATAVHTLLAGYRISPELAPLFRWGVVQNSPADGPSATTFTNPLVGLNYVRQLDPAWRAAFFLGVTLPLGSTGGNVAGDPGTASVRAANAAGILARSAMDNALFATNYLTVIPGVSLAYVARGLTAQVETTVLQLNRVRGREVDPEALRTNFTTGVHLGYFVLPEISLSAEVRYQRWLAHTGVPSGSPARDTLTVAAGPRLHLKLREALWLRPGIAYARGLDRPMTAAGYHVIHVDVPVMFF